MPSSRIKKSKPKADKADSVGIAQLEEWGSQFPIDNNVKTENEPTCFQFKLNLPKLPNRTIMGIDPKQLPML
jgi:hypothetical protein